MDSSTENRLKTKDYVRLLIKMGQFAWESSPSLLIKSIIITIFEASLPVSAAWVFKKIIDIVAANLTDAQPINMTHITLLIIIQLVILILRETLPTVQSFLNKALTRAVEKTIHHKMYSHLNQLEGVHYFESPEFQNLIQLSRKSGNSGPYMVVYTLFFILRGMTMLLSFIVVVAALSLWVVALLLITTIPQFFILTRLRMDRYNIDKQLSAAERKRWYFTSILYNAEVAKEVRVFGLGKHFLDKLMSAFSTIHTAKHDQDKREMKLNVGLQWLSSAVNGITFAIVIIRTVQRLITLGDVTLYNSAINNVQSALKSIVVGIADLGESALFFSNLDALLNLEQPITISDNPQPVPALTHGIELQDVWFRYDDELPWVLEGVSLFIPAGSCLALVGLNGAGKSTLVKLLTRMYDPTKGAILWDGQDIKTFDPAEYREHLGTVYQDFVKYQLSAAENIGMGNVERADDMSMIKDAAVKSGVAPIIDALPKQYDTVLSRHLVSDAYEEVGTDLSGGQWQRVAIARTFMREADLLILDEPTAALDAEAEHDMYSRFAELMSGRTSVLISHRFSTVTMATLIAVLADGKITEQGTHAELMARPDGAYQQLYRKQADRYE